MMFRRNEIGCFVNVLVDKYITVNILILCYVIFWPVSTTFVVLSALGVKKILFILLKKRLDVKK